jgi:hypothetical protein
MAQGAIPSAIRFQRWKAPEVFGMALPFAGRQSERTPWPTMQKCTSTRTGLHPVSHASPATKGARKSQERGTARFTPHGLSAPFFRPARFPCPTGPPHGVARGRRAFGLSGSALEAERRGITRSSLRRIELESSLHSKEEESSSVKNASCAATTAGPTPASGEDSARGGRARVSYFENSLQKSKSYGLAQRSTRINQTSGCARGPNRYNRTCESSQASYR